MRFAILVFAWAFLLPASTQAAVGRTAGGASVSSQGNAGYTIPLTLPPGINGVTPSLSLDYSHARNNTFVGLGWAIGGLSYIKRCFATTAQNGTPASIALSTADRLCLDGNQLRRTGGTYGAAGSTYQTEIETFARITAVGTAGNGPASFVAELKNGLIYEYGNTTDSRIEEVQSNGTFGTTPKAWALNKIRDRSGNSIQFNYTDDAATRSHRISSITYPHTAAGQGPFYSVDFVPEARPASDPINGSEAGGRYVETQRLDRIDISGMDGGWQLLKRYELTHDSSGATARSRVVSVQECASASDCLSATEFTYSNGAVGWDSEVSTAQTVSTWASALTMDMTGDGRSDVVYCGASNSWWLMPGTASGLGAPVSTNIACQTYQSALALDFNADGKMDLMVPTATNFFRILVSTGTSFSEIGTSIPAPAGGNMTTGDVDGDGRPDLIYTLGTNSYSYDHIYVRLNNGTGFGAEQIAFTLGTYFQFTGSSGPFAMSPQNKGTATKFADYNGDGRLDVIVQVRWDRNEGDPPGPDWRYRAATLFGNGSTFSGTIQTPVITATATQYPVPADGDGDGIDDTYVPGTTNWMFKGVDTGTPNGSIANVKAADWDGDRRVDLVTLSGGGFQVSRSRGTAGFDPPVSLGMPFASTVGAQVADINGDGLVDWIYADASNVVKFRLHSSGYPDLLTTATDGFGIQTTFQYNTVVSESCYARDASAPAFPSRDYHGPKYVVCGKQASNGIGGTYSVEYDYFNASTHLQGRGFLGFQRVETRDLRNSTVLTQRYSQEFPFIGLRVSRLHAQANGTRITESTDSLASHSYDPGTESRQFPYVSQRVEQVNEVGGAYNGELIRTTSTSFTVNSATGSASDTTTTVVEGSSANGAGAGTTHTSRVFHSAFHTDSTTWCIGRPSTTEVTRSHTLNGGGALTRTLSTTWDGAGMCRPTQSVIEPGNANWQASTDYGYDTFGNVDTVTVTPASGQGQAARTTYINWGTSGRFPVTVTNAKGQVTTFGWDYLRGLRTSVQDPNGISVSNGYDTFARLRSEQRPDGTSMDYVLDSCSSANNYCTTGASDLRYAVLYTAKDSGSATIRSDSQYFDGFDRLRYTNRQLLLGGSSTRVTQYDALGRVAVEYTPFTPGDPAWGASYSYDLVNRPTSIQRQVSEADANVAITQFSYEGLRRVVTDPLSHSTSQIYDAIGEIIRSIDAAGDDIDYEYDAFGNLLKTRDVAGNENVHTFNIRGMKMTSSDPDMGGWSYNYYPLGELKSQSDAKGQTTSFTYDDLSRPLTRVEAEGTTVFTWDTATNGIGQLRSMSYGNYAQENSYDSIGRQQQTKITIDGADFFYDFAYQATSGMLDTLTYPASVGADRFKVRYAYQYGLLSSVQSYVNNVAGTTYWQSLGSNARGQTILEALGNGLQTESLYDRITGDLTRRLTGPAANGNIQNLTYGWDAVGNLKQRRDANENLTEDFFYDSRDRLDYSELNGVVNLDVGYDAVGNIMSKSDVGTYHYDSSRPHAVTSTTGTISNSYAYDANGNMQTRNGASTTWTSYNYPSLINGPNKSLAFSYGPDRQRYRQIYTSGSTVETTLYIGGALEKVTQGATTDWRHYVSAGGRKVAVVNRASSGVTTTKYLHQDHQGSISHITDSAGAAFVGESFSAFGARRDAEDWTGECPCPDLTKIKSVTRIGFTDHEMIGGVSMGLIHMNGRVFDSSIGRFMSPDPYVQAPSNTQSFNRYSYAFNNPLSYSDPSGFVATDDIPKECTENCPGHDVDPGNTVTVPGSRPPPPPPPIGPDPNAPRGTPSTHSGGSETRPCSEDCTGTVTVTPIVDPNYQQPSPRVELDPMGYLRNSSTRGLWSAWSRFSHGYGNAIANQATEFSYALGRIFTGHGSGPDFVTAGYGYAMVGLSAIPGGFADEAARSAGLLRLEKQLASEAQVAQLLVNKGTVMAGAGVRRQIDDLARLLQEHGGKASDWAKVTSSPYRTRAGELLETHAYEDLATGEVVELKSILTRP